MLDNVLDRLRELAAARPDLGQLLTPIAEGVTALAHSDDPETAPATFDRLCQELQGEHRRLNGEIGRLRTDHMELERLPGVDKLDHRHLAPLRENLQRFHSYLVGRPK